MEKAARCYFGHEFFFIMIEGLKCKYKNQLSQAHNDGYHSLLDFNGNAHHLTWTTDIDMLTLKPSYPEAKSLKVRYQKCLCLEMLVLIVYHSSCHS